MLTSLPLGISSASSAGRTSTGALSISIYTAPGSQNDRLAHGEPGREERSARKRRRSVDGSVEWMGAWTGAAAREIHYLLDETLPAHSGAPLSPSLFRWRLFSLHLPPSPSYPSCSPTPPPGYNHSVNFLDGVMGYANGRCMLDYICVIVKFISQHEYKDLIPMFGIVNKAYLPGIGRYVLTSLYAALLPPLFPSAAAGAYRGAGRGWRLLAVAGREHMDRHHQSSWKIGPALDGVVCSALSLYQLGLQNAFINPPSIHEFRKISVGCPFDSFPFHVAL
ncbi:hypothetical protein B0H13DRAFT_2552614 [Mycena leptocephala]|nr:hypothetical protein B0H13DRAFT_2669825 [Mycena leptocephala]KAJ7873219.1 hypothetical protein B0H13DRAFT_2552614 [Mycena leptocephala]